MDFKYKKRKDYNILLVNKLKYKLKKIKDNLKKSDKNRMNARDRINYLLDPGSKSIEIGAFAAYNMYKKEGGYPCAGVIVKMGYIKNRICIIVANDSTLKSGAWFPMTVKKNIRAQEISIENKIPIIYLVDSSGVYLPMQNKVFPDKYHFGRIFRNSAKMSAMGIPQIAAIMGNCIAGSAYLPIMSDEVLIVEGHGKIFLANSYLVKAAIGENIDDETLGGYNTHCSISGNVDYRVKNDKEAINKIKNIIDRLGYFEKAKFNRIKSFSPKKKIEEIYGILPISRYESYDMYEIIQCITDNSSYDEYKIDYAKTIICCYARIDGWSVGIIANQRKIVRNSRKEMQLGGVIYYDSAIKASRFISNCNQKKIPMIFLQDVTGFMVGSRSEKKGIIKNGSKMINAISNSIVPKFTIIIGNSYGAGNYAMCGKAYDPRIIISWPSSEIAVMGINQITELLSKIQKIKIDNKIKNKYKNEINPYYAAARLWVDAIIDPIKTRLWISMGIEAANNAPINKKFNLGLIHS